MRDRFLRWFGGRARAERLREAAGSAAAGRDEAGWRPLGGAPVADGLDQARMQRRALRMWERNLFARRMVEMPIAWLLGDGVRLTAEDAQARAWLDEFWRDPVTDMPRNLPRMMREFALFGEQCWPVFADPHSGHVRLGYLDPCRIDGVIADPDNAARPVGVTTAPDGSGRARRFRVAVAGPETVFAPPARRLRATMADGEAFLFQTNRLMTGGRGRSDLVAAFDWLEDYERFLRGELDRADFLRAFVWDVRLDGARPDEVERRAAEIAAPAPGTVRVHNEGETWQAISPALQAQDAGAGARLFRNHVLSGLGWPEHWFGGGGDVNRATAAEMGDPAFKTLLARRREWTAILEEVGSLVVRRRIDPAARGAAPLEARYTPRVEWPELVRGDESRHAAALARTVAAAAEARDRGMIGELTALRLVRAAAERLGVTFDPAAERAALRSRAPARDGSAASAGGEGAAQRGAGGIDRGAGVVEDSGRLEESVSHAREG